MFINRRAINRSGIVRPIVLVCLTLLTAGLVAEASLAQQPAPQPQQQPQPQPSPRQDPGRSGVRLPAGTMVGGFVGFTDRESADFTLGVRVEFPLQSGWSAGATIEHTPDGYRESDSTLVMGLANFRPMVNQRLNLTAGAGVEFNDAVDDNVMFRAGAGYDLFYDGGMVFAPEIGLNFGEGDESITLGASLKFNF